MKRNSSIRRQKILEAVQSAHSHPTAEWVYDRVKQEIQDLSLGTVYRNLKILAEEGLVRVIHSSDGKDHFDGQVEPHHHLICEQCGKIMDYHSPQRFRFLEAVEKKTGFTISSSGLRLTGLCKECQENFAKKEFLIAKINE